MKKWFNEEWEFFITVKNDNYKKCRLGLETGDVFRCNYEVPCDFCPKTIPILYTLCEVVRCGGNYTLRGSEKPYEIDFKCPDGFVEFKLIAKKIEEQKAYIFMYASC